MLQAGQIRAARALLAWRQEDLAKAAKIGLATIARIEQREGPAQGHVAGETAATADKVVYIPAMPSNGKTRWIDD